MRYLIYIQSLILNMNYKSKKEKPFEYQIGSRYRVEGKNYVIVEKDYNKTYGYLLDENDQPYGRKRILGSPTNKKIEPLQ